MAAARLALALLFAAACVAPAGAPATISTTTTPAAPATAETTPQPTASAIQSPPVTPSPTGRHSPSPTESGQSSPAPVGLPEGAAWSTLDVPSGPSPREDHTWTVARDGKAAYLFGGRAGSGAFGDLWRYDLTSDSWTELAPQGVSPAARFGHVAVWHGELGLVVWSGQADATTFFADVWAYDPDANTWHELPSTGDVPIARYGSCGGIGPDGRLWISHGFTDDAGRFRDTRAYDFASGAWSDATAASGPVERCLHDCFWSDDGQLVLYAGQTTGLPALGDLWTYDATSAAWSEQPTPPPPARQLYAVAALGGSAYIFGGGAVDGGYLDGLWRLTLADLSWMPLEPAGDRPAARSGATLVADPVRARLLLFGGTDGDRELADLSALGGPPR
ncbi:MAG: hypothetical protein M3N29_05115 [Chloroflexota bacterium]|nr:hypothetical protein [Chloroflexota bacterium]